jgi:CBS domain-containing protein
MMPFVLTLKPRASIAEAAALMASHGVHRLLVVSSAGDLVGVVHARDVLRALARAKGVFVPDDADETWRKSCESAH